MKLIPYLNFNGDCEEAFKFYEKCFGGKIVAMMNHDHPAMEGHVPAEWKSKIMHARLYVGDQALMGSDSPPEHYKTPQGLNVTLSVDSSDEADRIFNELASGGNVVMQIDETFFATRFGMVTDRFGTPWMIVCEKMSS